MGSRKVREPRCSQGQLSVLLVSVGLPSRRLIQHEKDKNYYCYVSLPAPGFSRLLTAE
jgi:hypothetical protein